jgi:putative oxidoreductase
MKNLTLVGRILFALPFVLFGINHFVMVNWYLGTFTSFIPLGPFTIMLTGFLMIVTGICIILNKYVRVSALTLAGLLLIFILSIHIRHLLNPESDKALTWITLLKDISLMGASLMISGLNLEKKV